MILKASESPYKKIDWISTGYGNLNTSLGGGVPTRKITEISGQNGVGKSTLALSIIAEAQKEKRDCLWADIEFSFDEQYAEVLGVSPRNLDLIQEEYAEDALDAIEEWARKHKNGVIVVDAIGALLPKQEAEKTADGKTIGAQAKLVSVFCRKMVPILAINNNALIVLNHQLIDIMTGKIKTAGGAKLEYHKSIWLMMRKANKRVMNGEQQVGAIIEAEIRKNKCAATMYQKTELTMLTGQGFLKGADLMEEAKEKLFTKKGQMWYWGDEKVARGDKGLREVFSDPSFKERVSLALDVHSAKNMFKSNETKD